MAHTEKFKTVLEEIKNQTDEHKKFHEEQKASYVLKSFRQYLEDDYKNTHGKSIVHHQYIGGLLCALDDLEGKEDVFETVHRLNEYFEETK